MDVCIGNDLPGWEADDRTRVEKARQNQRREVDASRGPPATFRNASSIDTLSALDADKYRVLRDGKAAVTNVRSRPPWLAGLFGLVLLLDLMSKLASKPAAVGAGMSFGASSS